MVGLISMPSSVASFNSLLTFLSIFFSKSILICANMENDVKIKIGIINYITAFRLVHKERLLLVTKRQTYTRKSNIGGFNK